MRQRPRTFTFPFPPLTFPVKEEEVTIDIDGPLAEFAKPVAGGRSSEFPTSRSYLCHPPLPQALALPLPMERSSDSTPRPMTRCSRTRRADSRRSIATGSMGRRSRSRSRSRTDHGQQSTRVYTYYQDRWVDVVDANAAESGTGNTAAFLRTSTDNVVRDKNVDLFLPSSAETSFQGPVFGVPSFNFGDSKSGDPKPLWKFQPLGDGPS